MRPFTTTLAAIMFALVISLSGWILWTKPYADNPLVPRPTKEALVPNFDHIVTIVEENHEQADIIDSAEAPYLTSLAHQSALANNYYATHHSSLLDYLDLTSGTNAGIAADCTPPGSRACLADVPNITDEIEKSGHTWKAYLEDMPGPCGLSDSGEYVTRHNPFVYYSNILKDKARCQEHDVPFSQLANDIADNSLPNYVFIVPSLCNDMHNCSVRTGDDWLAREVPKILDSSAFTVQNSLLTITWDESEVSTASKDNNVAAILVGPHVKKSYISNTHYTHYSLLHTIENAWGLDSLTDQDGDAPIMNEFFN